MSGRDKDRGKAHAAPRGKKNKFRNRIDVTSDPTRQWVRPTGVAFRNIDERTGTLSPTATTPPPFSTPFPTILPAATTSQPPTHSPNYNTTSYIRPASFSAASTSQPPAHSMPGFAMPEFTPPSTHSPGYNTTHTTPYIVREGFNTSVPPPLSNMEMMQDIMREGNFLDLMQLAEQPQQQQPQQQQPQQQQQQNNQDEEVPSGGDQQRRPPRPPRRHIDEAWEYVDNLLVVTPTPETLEPSKGVSEYIRLAIHLFYPKNRCWAVYKDLTVDDRATLFNYFSKFCVWQPHHHALVEKNFHKVAAKRLSDFYYDERKELKKRKGIYRPSWIGEKSWELLNKYWMEDPHFNNRSKANKVNRASNVGGQLHAQGCVSTATYARNLKNTLQRDPYPEEIHEETRFSQRKGRYVDARASNTRDDYDTNVAKYLAENSGIPSYPEIPYPIKLKLWAKVAGKGRPSRMYGLGPLAGNVVHGNLFYVPPPPESSSRSRELPLEMQSMMQQMNQELQSQKEALARKEESENELRELLAKQAEEMRKLQRMVTKRMGGMKSRKTSESSSPSSQLSPSVQEDQIHDDNDDNVDDEEDEVRDDDDSE